jgi:signal transduction histidine kinase/DNA-binding CsgD family transcriptional regulator
MVRSPSALMQCRAMRHAPSLPSGRPPGPGTFDALTALAASADLSCCELDQTAWVLHCLLRDHQPHDAVALTVNGRRELLSQWTSPAFAIPSETDWSTADAARTLGRPILSATGEAGTATVRIIVVLARRHAPLCFGVDIALQALARVIAARVGRTPAATDTAQLSLAHAVAAERERLSQELTHHFAQHLQTILGQLRGTAVEDSEARIQHATTMALHALADLRVRRAVWRQAERVDEAFAALEREIVDLTSVAGVGLERTLSGRPDQLAAHAVLETASWITSAAVLNVLEHAGAARCRVGWSVLDHELLVTVVDDGCGFDALREARGGLRAMRRRAEMLGGSLDVTSVPGWGTRLRARLRLHAGNALRVDESASALVRTLADRELDVLRLIAVGHRNRDIAAELALSHHTVKFHLRNIFDKLGVRTRAEAAALAFAAGIHPRPAPAASGA